jgi:hypothetical protein
MKHPNDGIPAADLMLQPMRPRIICPVCNKDSFLGRGRFRTKKELYVRRFLNRTSQEIVGHLSSGQKASQEVRSKNTALL